MRDSERSDDSSISSEPDFVITNRQIFLIVLNFINHILVVFTAGATLYMAAAHPNDGLAYPTNQHAFFCTIGYPLLMAEAICALAGENNWTFFLSRRGNSHLHWILQAIGAVCIFYGITVEYMDKGHNTVHRNPNHFQSTHAFIGIVSVSAIIVVFLSGLPALFAGTLRKKIKPVISKFTHNSLGTFCFVTGMVAQILGIYQKNWMRSYYGETWTVTLCITTLLITVLSLMGALRQLSMQFKGTLRVIKS